MAKKLTVSVVVTVYNEVGNISDLIHSLIHQTLKPAEIIIVDAGSTDSTIATIEQSSNRAIKLIVKKGANRSVGRNLGIATAKHHIIAITDAGCLPQPDWLQKITQPLLSKQADSVAGFYQPVINSLFQQCIAPFIATMPHQFDPHTYLPSSRSIAFTKSAWQKAGKYPQALNYCEDLVFANNLKSRTHMQIVPEAQVLWQLPTNIIAYFHQIKNYAYGDIQAHFRPHLIKIASMYCRYLVFLFLPQLFGVYLFYTIFKHRYWAKTLQATFYLIVIQLTTDLAVITGSLQAIINY